MTLRPRSVPLFAQVLALTLLTLVAAQSVNIGLFYVYRAIWAAQSGVSLADAAYALRTGKAVERGGYRLQPRIVETPPDFWDEDLGPIEPIMRSQLAGLLGVPSERVQAETVSRRPAERRMLRSIRGPASARPPSRPGDGAPSLGLDFPFDGFGAAVRLPTGKWRIVEPPPPSLNYWQSTMIWFLASALLIAPLVYLFARRLVRPIRRFAEAAERIGRDPNSTAIEVGGPSEIRVAATALNEMQARIGRYVEERTAMAAAVAHDMRTPLMRLRFRVEGLPPQERSKAESDIAEMDAMISASLAFARADKQPLARVPLDLTALVQALVDDSAETGADILLEPSEAAVVQGDAVALRRLVANLIGNGISYGQRVHAQVLMRGAAAVVRIDDDGPGLPEAELERVFEPFYRCDPARERGSGGVGLGLAVARSLAQAHGGDIALLNRKGGGLRAELTLPAGSI